MTSPDDRAQQRQQWAKAVAAAKRQQRAQRHKRAAPRPRAGMGRVQPQKPEAIR